MVVGKIHTGNINTDFQVLIQDTDISGNLSTLDVSLCTNKYIIISDPDGNESQFDASFLTTGTDGIIRYINTSPSLLDEGGVWSYKAKVVFSDGGTFTTNKALFEVLSD